MISDLHLYKLLEGKLPREEAIRLIARMKEDDALRKRFEEIKSDSSIVYRPRWHRLLLEKQPVDFSSIRFHIIMPSLLLLIFLVVIGWHWFAQGRNASTFTLVEGNSEAMELLYHGEDGWRFLNQDYTIGDSLSLAVRDTGSYHVAVYALYGQGDSLQYRLVYQSESALGPRSQKPVFSAEVAAGSAGSDGPSGQPRSLLLHFSPDSLSRLEKEQVLSATRGTWLSGPAEYYQVLATKP